MTLICISLTKITPWEWRIVSKHQQMVWCQCCVIHHIITRFRNGLLFMTFSVSHNNVCIMSSFMTGEDLNNASKILRIVLIIRSQTPPWWEASGGLNSHATLRCLSAWTIFARSSWARHRSAQHQPPQIWSHYRTIAFVDILCTKRTSQMHSEKRQYPNLRPFLDAPRVC